MTLPTAPSRTMSQDTFDATTDAFIGALPQFEIDMNALAAAMTLNATTDTSTSSVAIGTGAKTFTVSAGKSFWPGMWLVIADTAAPTTNAMFAQVTSYSGTSLVVDSKVIAGSGTKASWQISQSSPAALDGLYSTPAQLQAGTYTAFTTGGTGTAFTLTPSPAIVAYAANQSFDVIFHAASGAAPTLAISGVATPPNLVRQLHDGSYVNLASGDFPAGWQSKVKLVSATQALVPNLPKRIKAGTITRDLTAASGSVAETGLTFQPSRISFRAVINGTVNVCIGEYAGVVGTQNAVYQDYSATFKNIGGGVSLIAVPAAGNNQQGGVSAVGADGFTIAWAKTGAPTGTLTIYYIAEE